MAGSRISGLDPMTAAETASNDDFVVFDTSSDQTKRISRDELAATVAANAPFTPVGFVAATTLGAAVTEIVVDLAAASGATRIGNTPAGNIAATTVQAAINELDAEKQPLDAGLTSIAGLTTAADRVIYTTAPDTYAVTPLTAAGRALIDDADAAAQRTTLGLVIGTHVQAQDAGLQSIANLTTSADQLPYTTAPDTYAVTPLTAAGRALIDDANAAAQRTTLGATTIGSDIFTAADAAAVRTLIGVTSGGMTQTVITASGNYTVPAGVTRIIVECQGGGGGGGFADPASSLARAAGGGRAGSWALALFTVTPGAVIAVTVGAAGAGGTLASSGVGGTGGTTTFDTLSAPGGVGGLYGAMPVASLGIIGEPAANAAVSGAAISTPGAGPGLAIKLDANTRASGAGGDSRYGAGGAAILATAAATATAGSAGTGFGAGGSGAVCSTTTSANGGAGSPGLIVVWEIR